MAEENKCKVCGDKFEEKEDLTAHGKNNHVEFTETYAKEDYGLGGRPKNEDDRAEDLYDQFDEQDIFHVGELVDQGADRTDAIIKVAKDAGYEAEEDHPRINISYMDKDGNFKSVKDFDELRNIDKKDDADEIDQQQDKPVQTHDEWKKELEGLQDEFSEEGGAGSGPREGSTPALLPEQSAMKNINPEYDPFKSTPKSQLMQSDPYVTRTTEEAPKEDELIWDTETKHYVKAKEQEAEPSINMQDEEGKPIDQDKYNKWEKEIPAEEDRGTDAILGKVANLAGGEADLAENYRYISKDQRAKIFESIGLNQGDANILAGLQWNELTRPIRVEASESYSKELNEEEEKLERYSRVNEEPEEEDEAYERFYNLEKNHSSPDYKKKAIECNRCNEKFYHIVDRDVHFNEVHATEDTYKLPEECPFCHIELPEGQDLDYHMSTAHGAHVPSEYTQAGVDAGMSDANWDRIEYAGASRANEKGETYIFLWRQLDLATRENMMRNAGVSTSEAGEDWEQLPSEITEPIKLIMNQLFRETGRESRAGDLKKEIKKLTNFINIASIENPMNMGYKEDELQGLKDELESLGGEELEATEGQGGTYGRSSYMLNPEHTDETQCIVCGRTVSNHSNPNTDYRGMRGDAPPTDHYFLGGDTGGSDDKYDFESKATEDGMYANFGKKDNDDSWTVLTVGSDLLFFNSREEAEDYTKNFPSDTYQISPPKSGKESYAKEDDDLNVIFSDYKNNEQAPYSEQSFEDFVAINYPYMLTPHESRTEFHKWIQGESYAKESNMDQWWWKDVKWESGFDQDFLYCNHCGADLYAEASWVEPLNNVGDDKMNRVVPDHLRNHGISESYSKETLHGDTNKEGLFYWKPTNEWLEDSDWELRDIIEGHPKVEEADTRWVKGQDEKWHEIDSSDRDYEQGFSEKPEAEEIIGAVGMGARAVVGAGAKAGTNVAGRIAGDEEEGENECEGCGRLEDYLNDENLCEDCEREAGIDRKESERDAYD